MTFKQQSKDYCREVLRARGKEHLYTDALFESYYRKHKPGTVFSAGSGAADFILICSPENDKLWR